MGEIQNVIAIDDSETSLKILEKLLAQYPFKSHCFNNPQQALEEIGNIKPNIILLDYHMPQMNGEEFMVKASERLLNHNWQVFLVSSAKFTEEQRSAMLTLGITHVFEKPLNKKEFDEAIENFGKFF